MTHEDLNGIGSLPGDEWGTTDFQPPSFDDLRKVPRFQQVFDLVRAKPEVRVNQLRFLADAIVKDPGVAGQVYDNLELIGQLKPEEFEAIEEVRAAIPQSVEAAVINRTRLEDFTQERIEQLVKVHLEVSGPVSQVIEVFLLTLFQLPKTVEEAVDLNYSAAWAMVLTSDSEVRKEILSILCFEDDLFPANSEGAMLVAMGRYADDNHLSKLHAFEDILDHVGMLVDFPDDGVLVLGSGRVFERAQRMDLAYRSLPDELREGMDRFATRDLQRWAALTELYFSWREDRSLATRKFNKSGFSGIKDLSTRKLESERALVEASHWPESVVLKADEPLRLFVRERFGPQLFRKWWDWVVVGFSDLGYSVVTERPIEIVGGRYYCAIIAKGPLTWESKAAIVSRVIDAIISHKPLYVYTSTPEAYVLDQVDSDNLGGLQARLDDETGVEFAVWRNVAEAKVGALSSMLEYCRPIISVKDIQTVAQRNIDLREAIKTSFTRVVGRRGYEVYADPSLRQYGYQSITFRETTEGDNIEVEVKIGGNIDSAASYNFFLDSNLNLAFGGDVLQFLSLQDRAWLGLLTLSHLKRVMCLTTREEEIADDLLGGQVQYETGYKRQVVSRGDHLREQSPRHGFTPRAFELYLQSRFYRMFKKDLATLNRERGRTFDTGMLTYVSSVDYEREAFLPPIKLAFRGIREDIEAVVDLDKVSDEEIERITAEILGEIQLA